MAAITYTSGRTDGGAGVHVRARGAARRDQQVPGTEAALDRHRKGRSVFPAAPERARSQQAGPGRSRRSIWPPTDRGPFAGRSVISDMTTDADDFERGHRAQQVLGALKRLAEVMGGIRGRRKAIVMFSEGIDYPIYDIFGSQAATTVMMATRDAIAAAARANVSFFSIDPRGLVGMTSEAIELNAAADRAPRVRRQRAPGRHVSLAGQSAHARGRDWGICSGQLQQCHDCPQPHRPAEQHVLRAGLLPEATRGTTDVFTRSKCAQSAPDFESRRERVMSRRGC